MNDVAAWSRSVRAQRIDAASADEDDRCLVTDDASDRPVFE